MPINSPQANLLPLQITSILFGITGFMAYAFSKFTTSTTVVYLTIAGFLGFLITFIFLMIMLRRPRRILAGAAVTLAAVVVGGYAVLFVVIFFFQDTIANRMNAFFQPQPLSAAAAREIKFDDVEDLEFQTPDGVTLRGWLVRNPAQSPAPLLIYFDGSGSEVSQMIPSARRLRGWSVALVNYRGFGLSEGVPSQAHVFADAVLIYDALAERVDINPGRISAMGYSQGTGVAVYLAEQRKLEGVILAAPYDRLTLVGLKKPPIYAPLQGIMKPYFDSLSRAPLIHATLLCLIGAEDTAVPPALSQRLADAWGGEKTVNVYAGENHGLLVDNNSAWDDIAAFLGRDP